MEALSTPVPITGTTANIVRNGGFSSVPDSNSGNSMPITNIGTTGAIFGNKFGRCLGGRRHGRVQGFGIGRRCAIW